MDILKQAIDQAKRINIYELVRHDTKLKPAGGGEWGGPCPRCKGDNRFRVRVDGWFCRQCNNLDAKHGWHDAIDYVMWMDGKTFEEAILELTGIKLEKKERTVTTERTQPVQEEQTASWRQRAAQRLQAAQAALWDGDDSRGRDYLLSRGLEPHTWQRFGLGYELHYSTQRQGDAPAIVMPWHTARGVVALRYRFTEPDAGRIVSLKGSKFNDVLFGATALMTGAERLRTLVLCEGEINAMSIWQVAHEAGVDVLSTGSESAQLSGRLLDYVRRFKQVLVWMDKPQVVQKIIALIPQAQGINSPGEQDANDLLLAGTLGTVVGAMRWKAARCNDDKWSIYWDIWDAAHTVQGVDSATAKALALMGKELGRESDLIEVEPNRWITKRSLKAA